MRDKQKRRPEGDETTAYVEQTDAANAGCPQETPTPFREAEAQQPLDGRFRALSFLTLSFLALRRKEKQEAQERLQAEKEAARLHADALEAMNLKLLTVQAELEAQYRALETANERLAALATTDGMTGLANHRAFQEELSRQVARAERSHTALTLLLLDVDRFKEYNDAFGHPAGDLVLKAVGRLLQSQVREGDYCARYGGEEFAVLLPDTDTAAAVAVAERLRRAVKAHDFAHREITVSVGVARRGVEESADVMICRADTALYQAKSAGRDCVVALESPQADADESATMDAERPGKSGKTGTKRTLSGARPTRSDAASQSALPPAGETDAPTPEFAGDNAGILFYGGLEGLLQEPSVQLLTELLAVLDQRGAEPRGHSERVTRYMMRLSLAIADLYEEQRSQRPLLPRLSPNDLTHFALGALLHDIGTIGIPDSILQKTEKLTEEEWRQIRRHPLAGAELMAGNPLLARALPIVRYHHERWDGDGYPQGLTGCAIPLGARLFALCDTFDSLTTDRPYRKALDFVAARAEIERASGTQFDPDVVQAFLRVREEEWQELRTPGTAKQIDFPVMSRPRAA